MLLRHVVSHRTTIFFRGFPGRASSMSNTVETGANETCNTSSKDIKPIETYNRSNRKDKRISQQSDPWDLGRALASSESQEVDIEYFTRQKQRNRIKKDTKNTCNLERGPKNAVEMYRSPYYSTRLFPWIYDPKLSPLPPAPTTSHELVANLTAMRNISVISLNSLILYHEGFSSLQSTRSYDTLIEVAVRWHADGTIKKLVDAMMQKNIALSSFTYALITRLAFRRVRRAPLFLQTAAAKHVDACSNFRNGTVLQPPDSFYENLMADDIEQLLKGGVSTPLNALIECLSTPHRADPQVYKSSYISAYRREMYKFKQTVQTRRQKEARKRIRQEYSRLKMLPAKDFVPRALSLPPEVLKRLRDGLQLCPARLQLTHLYVLLVRRLLLLDKRQTAFDLARTYIYALCRKRHAEDPKLSVKVFRLINLFLHPKYGCLSISAGLNTLAAFLQIDANLKPSATTLFVLLQNLRNADRRAERANELLLMFQQRWGVGVEDNRVRRTVAKLALQDRSGNGPRIAEEMARREARFGANKVVLSGALQELRRPQLKSFAEIYAHRHREKEKWIKMGLVKRLSGFVVRRKSADKVDTKTVDAAFGGTKT